MATIAKERLSGETAEGESSVLIAATTTAGTTIHTAVTGTSDIDEVWLWANNIHTSAVTLVIEWGNVTANRNIKVDIDPNETVLIVPGWVADADNVIAAFCATTNVVNIHGYVNRITG